MHYLTVDFAIGMARNLDIVAKRLQHTTCYAINNDSFGSRHFQHPEYGLPSGTITCTVHVQGIHVDETFTTQFTSGAGPLQLASPPLAPT